MKLRFLCPERRQWLLQNADAARHTLHAMQEVARLALASGDSARAIRPAGSALECAELMILTHRRLESTAIDDFRQAAELLGRALELGASRELACTALCGSIATLQSLDKNRADAGRVYAACQALLSQLQHGSGADAQAPCKEADSPPSVPTSPQQPWYRKRAANDDVTPGQHSNCLQVELDVSLLASLLREKRLAAAHLRVCNPRSAALLRDLLLDCLSSVPGVSNATYRRSR